MTRSTAGRLSLILAAVVSAACGEDPVAVYPPAEPFVGTWDAVVLTMTPDPPTGGPTVDVLASGGQFFINIQPSGRYTATLVTFSVPAVEIGDIEIVNGSSLLLKPDGGSATAVAYSFATPDSLIWDGPSEFDFNTDGVGTPAQAHFELTR